MGGVGGWKKDAYHLFRLFSSSFPGFSRRCLAVRPGDARGGHRPGGPWRARPPSLGAVSDQSRGVKKANVSHRDELLTLEPPLDLRPPTGHPPATPWNANELQTRLVGTDSAALFQLTRTTVFRGILIPRHILRFQPQRFDYIRETTRIYIHFFLLFLFLSILERKK